MTPTHFFALVCGYIGKFCRYLQSTMHAMSNCPIPHFKMKLTPMSLSIYLAFSFYCFRILTFFLFLNIVRIFHNCHLLNESNCCRHQFSTLNFERNLLRGMMHDLSKNVKSIAILSYLFTHKNDVDSLGQKPNMAWSYWQCGSCHSAPV